MSLRTAVLALLLLPATARTEERPSARPPPPSTEHVRLVVDGTEHSGWTLDPTADGGFALLADDATIVVIPLPAPPAAPTILERVAQPVTLVPSPALVAGLEHQEAGVRDRCEELLGEQGDAALPHLGPALSSASKEARRRSLELLVTRPSTKWRSRVDSLRRDDDERVRQTALRAYAALKPTDLYERCVDSLRSDSSVLVRHEAIVLLGRQGDVRAVDPLLDELEGCEERSLRLVTFDALRRLTGRSFGRDEEKWRSWWTNHREEFLPESR
jgi:hypothetical protein